MKILELDHSLLHIFIRIIIFLYIKHVLKSFKIKTNHIQIFRLTWAILNETMK